MIGRGNNLILGATGEFSFLPEEPSPLWQDPVLVGLGFLCLLCFISIVVLCELGD